MPGDAADAGARRGRAGQRCRAAPTLPGARAHAHRPAPAAAPVGLARRERLGARWAREAGRSRARTPARGATCASPEGGFPRAHAPTATRRALLPPREQDGEERAAVPLGGKVAGWPTQSPCLPPNTAQRAPASATSRGSRPTRCPFPRPGLGQDCRGVREAKTTLSRPEKPPPLSQGIGSVSSLGGPDLQTDDEMCFQPWQLCSPSGKQGCNH